MPDERLATRLPRGVALKDPILLASGCCGFGEEYAEIVDPRTIGGIVTKAVSLEPRQGNSPPRLRETPAGLLNCIGLQNPGVESFCTNMLPMLEAGGYAFFINVVGGSPAEFAAVIGRVEQARLQLGVAMEVEGECGWAPAGFAGYELDLSCPNVDSGTQFATDEDLLRATVLSCRAVTEALVFAKLSPNVADIVPFARSAARAGADAVTIANTWCGMSIDISTRRSHLSRPSAGLSGAAIRPATLYHVWRCHSALPELPILGCGGITDADSAIQYLLAGATAIQVGTGLFVDPGCVREIQDGLSRYLDEQGEAALSAIVGTFAG